MDPILGGTERDSHADLLNIRVWARSIIYKHISIGYGVASILRMTCIEDKL